MASPEAGRRKVLSVLAAAGAAPAVLAATRLAAAHAGEHSMDDQPLIETSVERILKQLRENGRSYERCLDVDTLSAGIYHLPAGTKDNQQPHDLDEVYFVIEGESRFRSGDQETTVKPGSILYVPAHVDHRFFDIAKDLTILVLFSKATP